MPGTDSFMICNKEISQMWLYCFCFQIISIHRQIVSLFLYCPHIDQFSSQRSFFQQQTVTQIVLFNYYVFLVVHKLMVGLLITEFSQVSLFGSNYFAAQYIGATLLLSDTSSSVCTVFLVAHLIDSLNLTQCIQFFKAKH